MNRIKGLPRWDSQMLNHHPSDESITRVVNTGNGKGLKGPGRVPRDSVGDETGRAFWAEGTAGVNAQS